MTEEPALTPLVIGVTSHRNIPAREIEAIRQRVRELFAQLQREFPQLPLIVLSALAEGGDQLVAQVGSSRVDLQACKLEYSIVSPK